MTIKQLLVRSLLTVLPKNYKLMVASKSVRISKNLPAGIKHVKNNYLGEFVVELDTTYPIEREMVSGEYDGESLRLFERVLHKGDICVDIGANIGALSLAMGKLVGREGKLVCFEPGQINFMKLSKNLNTNKDKLPHYYIYQLGLSDKKGTLMWEEDENNLGNASLHESTGSEEVPIETLDKFSLDSKIDKVNFVKIDVEGMELQILKGAQRFLQKYKPKIYFETLPEFIEILGEENFLEIEEILKSNGYKLYKVFPNGSLALLDSILQSSNNTLAIHKDDKFNV